MNRLAKFSPRSKSAPGTVGSEHLHQLSQKFKRSPRASLILVTAILLVLTLYVLAQSIHASAKLQLYLPAVRPDHTLDWNDFGNFAWLELRQLEKTPWEAMSPESKLNLLQSVVNIESSLRQTMSVQVTTLQLPSGTRGLYSPESQSIQIDHDYLLQANWESILGTVLHEFKHSYDHYVAELAPVDPANLQRTRYRMALKFDMDHYIPGTIDTYQDYYHQQVEKDARQYAQNRLEWYASQLKSFGIDM